MKSRAVDTRLAHVATMQACLTPGAIGFAAETRFAYNPEGAGSSHPCDWRSCCSLQAWWTTLGHP
ncbi:MAG: hypothetical protein WC378_15450 [Opitutaceae bacterium]